MEALTYSYLGVYDPGIMSKAKRKEKVQIWARSSEKALWQSHAARQGVSFSEWVRAALDRTVGEEMRSTERSH